MAKIVGLSNFKCDSFCRNLKKTEVFEAKYIDVNKPVRLLLPKNLEKTE